MPIFKVEVFKLDKELTKLAIVDPSLLNLSEVDGCNPILVNQAKVRAIGRKDAIRKAFDEALYKSNEDHVYEFKVSKLPESNRHKKKSKKKIKHKEVIESTQDIL